MHKLSVISTIARGHTQNMADKVKGMHTDLLREASDDITNIFSGEENTETLYESVRNVLPIKEENFKIINAQGTARRFKAKLSKLSKPY